MKHYPCCNCALEATPLGPFADLYDTDHIPEYHDVVDTTIAWGEELLAYHHNRRASNRPIDGINNLHPSPTPRRSRVQDYDNFAARGILIT